jgi:hypothetical protein
LIFIHPMEESLGARMELIPYIRSMEGSYEEVIRQTVTLHRVGDGTSTPHVDTNSEVSAEKMLSLAKSSASKFIPEVEDNFKPAVGLSFSSVDSVHAFYNSYARRAGFSVRSSSCKYGREKDLYWKMFVCAKEGHTDNKAERKQGNLRRDRAETRQGCLACLTVRKEKDGLNWIVTKFIEEHTHALVTPSKRHLLKSHRHVSIAKKRLVDTFEGANINTSQKMAVLEIESGGYENIGCTERDVRNYERDKKEKVKGRDADLLFEYFEEMKELKPDFMYSLKVDAKNRMTHCF